MADEVTFGGESFQFSGEVPNPIAALEELIGELLNLPPGPEKERCSIELEAG
jgi:hypothetical protein